MTWTLPILIVVLAAFIAAWRVVPSGWLTVSVNLTAGALVIAAEVLQYMAGFPWREVMPAEYAPWMLLTVNVLSIAARKRPKVAS